MENIAKLMMVGFGALLFSTALFMIMLMYENVSKLEKYTGNRITSRSVLEEIRLE